MPNEEPIQPSTSAQCYDKSIESTSFNKYDSQPDRSPGDRNLRTPPVDVHKYFTQQPIMRLQNERVALAEPLPYLSANETDGENGHADVLVFTDTTLKNLKSDMITSVKCCVETYEGTHIQAFRKMLTSWEEKNHVTAVVMHIGFQDSKYGPAEGIKYQWRALLTKADEIFPNATVFVSAVLPCKRNKNGQNIEAFNNVTALMCKEALAKFINLVPVLVEDGSKIPDEMYIQTAVLSIYGAHKIAQALGSILNPLLMDRFLMKPGSSYSLSLEGGLSGNGYSTSETSGNDIDMWMQYRGKHHRKCLSSKSNGYQISVQKDNPKTSKSELGQKTLRKTCFIENLNAYPIQPALSSSLISQTSPVSPNLSSSQTSQEIKSEGLQNESTLDLYCDHSSDSPHEQESEEAEEVNKLNEAIALTEDCQKDDQLQNASNNTTENLPMNQVPEQSKETRTTLASKLKESEKSREAMALELERAKKLNEYLLDLKDGTPV